jgi:4-diphosphocytidyl-2-C-methyl-D-erythritol kinase
MAATTADGFDGIFSTVAARVETARAKINLALHVVGRRPDGYHLLDTLVAFADIGDTVEVSETARGRLALFLDGPFADQLSDSGPPRDNLVLRAARELSALPGVHPDHKRPGARIALTKRLPVAAGLGGGSADAAATLRLLDRFWNLGTPRRELAALGLKLGADVPMCLVSRPLRAEGIGEKIAPAGGIPALPLLLLNPGVSVSTSAVFARLQSASGSAVWPLPERFASIIEFAQWLRMSRNDLFEPAREEAPSIATAVKAMAADPDCLIARMSGSGATVFGLFNSRTAAERAAVRLSTKRPNWWLAVTETGASPGSAT